MSINNFNPIGQTLRAPYIPTPASPRISALAKVVIGIAALFFTAFLYVTFSNSSSSRSIRREDGLSEEQQREVNKITQTLHHYFDNPPSAHAEEFKRLYAKFTGGSKITPEDIAAANHLIVALSSLPSVSPVRQGSCDRETIVQTRALRDAQDKEYQEALEADQLRLAQKRSLEERQTAMAEALSSLQADLTQATSDLDVRYSELAPLDKPWGIIFNQARYGGLRAGETFTAEFQKLEERYHLAESIDRSIPKDLYRDQVARFNTDFPDEADFFAQKRKALTESYENYTTALDQVYARLAWVRLKTYHGEVGETFFTTQFSKELLGKVHEGEELPRPQ